MRPGIFETVFQRPTLEEAFASVRDTGFLSVQFDFASAGIGSQPEAVPTGVAQSIRDAADRAGIGIAAVSGTFNMIHLDQGERAAGLASLAAISESCAMLGTGIVTLCTGTRNTESMWRGHPDNGSSSAWADLLDTMSAALATAEQYDVRLVVEPEPANVASNADRARRLLDEMAHPRLKIVLDPANILAGDPDRSPEAALEHAFDVLGDDIILAHAKDLDAQGQFCAAGTGIVPWNRYCRLLEDISYDGDVIFHSLTEHQVRTALSVMAS